LEDARWRRLMSNKVKVFQINDCEWWAGENLETISSAVAEMYGYPSVANCKADGVIDADAEALEDALLDKLTFVYDVGEPTSRKCSFRERLEELITSGETVPCFFASTEY
jgi:hypothetical protein